MQFTNATLQDLPLIVEIYNSTIAGRMVTADTEPVTVADRLNWFNAHQPLTRPLWMIWEKDECLGWVSFNSFYGRPAYDGTAEISIYLHTAQRGKGYGKAILDHCTKAAPTLQIHSILGFIFSHNQPSISLFLQAGFEQWGMLKDIAVMDGRHYSLSIFGKKTIG